MLDPLSRDLQIFGRGKKLRSRIFQPEGELLEGKSQLPCGMIGITDFRRDRDEIFHARLSQARFKKLIGVVDVADHLVKSGEILGQILIQL